jgi:hypothetical protein
LTLPARRVEVYNKALSLILGKWRQSRRPQPLARITAKTMMLDKLAYQFSCEGKEIFSDRDLLGKITLLKEQPEFKEEFKGLRPSRLIAELSEDDGIIQKLSRMENCFIFLHRTFQEYLTASYIKGIIEIDEQAGIGLAKDHFWDFEWHETLAVLAGILVDPLPLLQAIRAEKDDIFFSLSNLAGRCLSECKQKNLPIYLEIMDRIYDLWETREQYISDQTIISLGQTYTYMRSKLYNQAVDSI